MSYGDIIKTGTFKKLSEVFRIKNLVLLKVRKIKQTISKNFRLEVFRKAALARNFEEEVINNVKNVRNIQYMFRLVKNLYLPLLLLFAF